MSRCPDELSSIMRTRLEQKDELVQGDDGNPNGRIGGFDGAGPAGRPRQRFVSLLGGGPGRSAVQRQGAAGIADVGMSNTVAGVENARVRVADES